MCWHETCKCKCILDESICNHKLLWNNEKCRCQCNKLINKNSCGKEFFWDPSNCNCEYDKSCCIGEHLNDENCKCRKQLVDKLFEK